MSEIQLISAQCVKCQSVEVQDCGKYPFRGDSLNLLLHSKYMDLAI